MTGPMVLVGTLGTIGSVLSFLVVLVGLVLTAVAYFRGKSRVALLGALGFLLMFLFSCCSLGGNLGWGAIIANVPHAAVKGTIAARGMLMFLLGILNVIGLALIAVALWIGGRKEG